MSAETLDKSSTDAAMESYRITTDGNIYCNDPVLAIKLARSLKSGAAGAATKAAPPANGQATTVAVKTTIADAVEMLRPALKPAVEPGTGKKNSLVERMQLPIWYLCENANYARAEYENIRLPNQELDTAEAGRRNRAYLAKHTDELGTTESSMTALVGSWRKLHASKTRQETVAEVPDKVVKKAEAAGAIFVPVQVRAPATAGV